MYTQQGWTIKLLTEKYNLSRFVISKVLTKNGIQTKRHTKRSGLFLREDYFETIDTEYKAYFVGLLFTDGNIFMGKNNMYQVGIELSVKDKDILEVLKKELNAGYKFSYRTDKNRSETVSLKCYSKKMVEDLSQYGIVPQKTKKTKHIPIDKIPQEYKRDFIRGMIDGDGSIFYYGEHKHLLGVTFCSYYASICEEMQQACIDLIGQDNPHKVHTEKDGHISRMDFRNQKLAKQLVTALYKDSKCHITRKYNLAKIVFESKNEEDIV